MPTGVPIRDIREQLFEAARRVLVRDGPNALTSRAVTTEAGVAKGILHRHFSDFDGFLAALVLTQIEHLDHRSAELRAAAGTSRLEQNLVSALAEVLDPLMTRTITLVCGRPSLIERLRMVTPTGLPLLAETARMVAAYLTAERGLGRIAVTADVDALGTMLVGGAYLHAAPEAGATTDRLHELVTTALRPVALVGQVERARRR